MSIQLPDAFKPLFQPARFKAYYGGRGSGKSHSFAAALLVKAAERPLRVLCTREIQDSIKDSVKRLLDDKIDKFGLSGFYKSLDSEIRGVNGSQFTFAGLRTNPESVKSKEGYDIAWIEEAATVSERSFYLLRDTIRTPGSEIWVTWNPRFENDPVETIFRKGEPPPRSIVRRVNYDQNPWFPPDLRESMEWDRSRDADKYAHIWLGDYQRNSEARVFNNWKVESFDTPPDARFYFGADWGFAIDPTVLVRCFIQGRTLYIDAEVYKVACAIDHTPALFMKAPEGVINWRPDEWQITADSARPETIDYMQRHGFPRITHALKGPSSVMDGIEFLKSYDIVVHPRCRYLHDELALYSFKTDKLTNEILPVLEDKKNHVIDALRYALESLRRAVSSSVKPLRL